MFAFPAHDLGVGGAAVFAVFFLAAEALVLRAVLTVVAWSLRFFERRRRDVVTAATGAPVSLREALLDPSPAPRPSVSTAQLVGEMDRQQRLVAR